MQTLRVDLRADFARPIFGYKGGAKYCRVPVEVDLSQLSEREIAIMESCLWTASGGDDLTEIRIVDRMTRAERSKLTPEQIRMYGERWANGHDALIYSWPPLSAETVYSTEKDPDTGSSLVVGARLTETGTEYVKRVCRHMEKIGEVELR